MGNLDEIIGKNLLKMYLVIVKKSKMRLKMDGKYYKIDKSFILH